MCEKERESVESLKLQLKQWRRLSKLLPETDCDRDDVAEIEKLVKIGLLSPGEKQVNLNDWRILMPKDKFEKERYHFEQWVLSRFPDFDETLLKRNKNGEYPSETVTSLFVGYCGGFKAGSILSNNKS